jgi:hypothetical protein
MFKAFSKVTDFVQDNYCEANAAEEEKKLRAAFPFLLRDDEKVCSALSRTRFDSCSSREWLA